MLNFLNDDTICALASPSGLGGVAIIRVSGPEASKIVGALCPKFKKMWQSHRVYFTTVFDSEHQEAIDEVLLSFFAKGQSYTGEETVEISCHGSPYIASRILKELIRSGARSAERGEFTYRSFMNQRIDLSQAESVLSLIESKSKNASRLSLRQLKGALSNKVAAMEESLTYVLANMEASIDFSVEDIDVLDYDLITKNLNSVRDELSQILSTYKKGRILKEGLNVAIVGRPNAGKSSLLNALIQEKKAIVSEVPGTTRDLIEVEFVISGNIIRFFDTAGIHKTKDRVENMGIEKSLSAIDQADFVLYIVEPDEVQLDSKILDALRGKDYEVWQSKSDQKVSKTLTKKSFHSLDEIGVRPLLSRLEDLFKNNLQENSAILFQARHYELFTKVKERVEKSLNMIKDDASQEFIALELQEALHLLYEVLGKRFDDEVMDRVFKEFCIGK